MLDSKRTLCKCPKCDGLHYVFFNFTGRGMPRKFCDGCKYYIEECGYPRINDDCGRVRRTKQKSRVEIPLGPLFEETPISQWPILPR